jgi:hypothetical protein
MTEVQAQFKTLKAAADSVATNGGILVPEFQKEITDLVRRAGALGQRLQYVPATGAISRFFEQTAISDGQWTGTGSQAAAPIGSGNIAPTPTGPTRVEKGLLIKAITNEISYSLFDLETIAQQGVFSQLKSKDLIDMTNGILRLRDKGLWVGADTVSGSQVGTNTGANGLQYVGLLQQITKSTTIATGASIVDNIRTQVAQLMADPNYENAPSAVYINPLALDFLEQEAKNSQTALRYIATDFAEAKTGLTVNGLNTVAGVLPLIPDPFMAMDATISGVSAAPGGQHNYPFAILNEQQVEFHYVGSKEPRVFQMGLLTGLAEQYVGVLFGAPVAKGGSYAHVVGAIQR